jgi:hypothetical protein
MSHAVMGDRAILFAGRIIVIIKHDLENCINQVLEARKLLDPTMSYKVSMVRFKITSERGFRLGDTPDWTEVDIIATW